MSPRQAVKMKIAHNKGPVYITLNANSISIVTDSVLTAAFGDNSFDFYVCVVAVCNGSLRLHVYEKKKLRGSAKI